MIIPFLRATFSEGVLVTLMIDINESANSFEKQNPGIAEQLQQHNPYSKIPAKANSQSPVPGCHQLFEPKVRSGQPVAIFLFNQRVHSSRAVL